jgi:hypothetical protein
MGRLSFNDEYKKLNFMAGCSQDSRHPQVEQQDHLEFSQYILQSTNMLTFIPPAVYIRNDGGSQREGERLRIFLCRGAPPRLTSVRSVTDCHDGIERDHEIHIRRTNLFNQNVVQESQIVNRRKQKNRGKS